MTTEPKARFAEQPRLLLTACAHRVILKAMIHYSRQLVVLEKKKGQVAAAREICVRIVVSNKHQTRPCSLKVRGSLRHFPHTACREIAHHAHGAVTGTKTSEPCFVNWYRAITCRPKVKYWHSIIRKGKANNEFNQQIRHKNPTSSRHSHGQQQSITRSTRPTLRVFNHLVDCCATMPG